MERRILLAEDSKATSEQLRTLLEGGDNSKWTRSAMEKRPCMP